MRAKHSDGGWPPTVWYSQGPACDSVLTGGGRGLPSRVPRHNESATANLRPHTGLPRRPSRCGRKAAYGTAPEHSAAPSHHNTSAPAPKEHAAHLPPGETPSATP